MRLRRLIFINVHCERTGLKVVCGSATKPVQYLRYVHLIIVFLDYKNILNSYTFASF